MIVCYWCQVSVYFIEGEGWVHQDGNKTRSEAGRGGKGRVVHWAEPANGESVKERGEAVANFGGRTSWGGVP